MNHSDLMKKYDVPVPRYTSYPTVPYWSDSPTTEEWLSSLKSAFAKPEMSWSLYLHIPYCETLCTFCGCNTLITKNHGGEQPYVELLLKEFELYLKSVPEISKRPLKQLHLGGGTPTFLSAQNLETLIRGLKKHITLDPKHFEGSLEVDPRRTNAEQLKVLFDLGFKRVSMGVQDFDPEVQRLVNRIQPFEQTQSLTQAARQMGYDSVNFDLIYGLPKQTLASFSPSIDKTIQLKPDRIALYSFALVPWIKPAQRLFKDSDLPVGEEKRALYEMAYQKLIEAGYIEIGMDHFALKTDQLAKAMEQKTLHRNFMGYADLRTEVLLGLGVSSISESPDCFHQNEKVLPVYQRMLGEDKIPTLRGHKLNQQDFDHREQILKFMTLGETELHSPAQAEDVRGFLSDMIKDGLVTVEDLTLRLTAKGKPFLRNACVALDQRLRELKPSLKVFSQAL